MVSTKLIFLFWWVVGNQALKILKTARRNRSPSMEGCQVDVLAAHHNVFFCSAARPLPLLQLAFKIVRLHAVPQLRIGKGKMQVRATMRKE